jgi:hypothetical protein
MIYLLILLLIISIIINVIISNSKNENFADPDKLMYIYDLDSKCPTCNEINTSWDLINKEINANPLYYNISAEKYKLGDNNATKLFKDNASLKPTAPTIIYKSGNKINLYTEKTKDITTSLFYWLGRNRCI